MKNCSCGENSFEVIVEGVTNAYIDSDGNLFVSPAKTEVSAIECTECGASYNVSDFNQVITGISSMKGSEL